MITNWTNERSCVTSLTSLMEKRNRSILIMCNLFVLHLWLHDLNCKMYLEVLRRRTKFRSSFTPFTFIYHKEEPLHYLRTAGRILRSYKNLLHKNYENIDPDMTKLSIFNMLELVKVWPKSRLKKCYRKALQWKFQQLYAALDTARLEYHELKEKTSREYDTQPWSQIIPITLCEEEGLCDVPWNRSASLGNYGPHTRLFKTAFRQNKR